MNRKKIGEIFIVLLILSLSTLKIYASEPSFSFYPSGGIIENVEEGFTVDILIDSGGYEITKARVVVRFDPKIVQLRGAMKNSSLFEEWPSDEMSTDNREGIVMLTGITSSGGDILMYKTSGSPDVFARLQFDVISSKSDQVTLSFEYQGEDELLRSVLMSAGTSSENVLTSKPASATYSLDSEQIPETAIDMNSLGIIVGILLMLVGAFVRNGKYNVFEKRRGTIVLEE